jgi:hypothetical protein
MLPLFADLTEEHVPAVPVKLLDRENAAGNDFTVIVEPGIVAARK